MKGGVYRMLTEYSPRFEKKDRRSRSRDGPSSLWHVMNRFYFRYSAS